MNHEEAVAMGSTRVVDGSSAQQSGAGSPPVERSPTLPLDARSLRKLCIDAGAEDIGLVEIGRPALDDRRDDILRFFPPTRSLISIVCRINREPVRNPARSVANVEFQAAGEEIESVREVLSFVGRSS